MRYIIVIMSSGYCGYEEERCLMFPKKTTNEVIIDYACELFDDYVERHEYLANGNVPAFYENCIFDYIEVYEGDENFNYHIEEFSMA